MTTVPTVARVYRDRAQAGMVLASRLARHARRDDLTVLALPRGGVPVAYPIARALGAPLDILAVRKLGVPGREELAMGAVAADGILIVNHEVASHLGIAPTTLDAAARVARAQLADQESRFRGNHPEAARGGRTVVLVDDGLATGSTMEAAIASCRQAGVAGIIVAVPIGAPKTVAYLAKLVEEVVCPETPAGFRAVGLAYADFTPVDDRAVIALFDRAARSR